jgi:hypothetical protein
VAEAESMTEPRTEGVQEHVTEYEFPEPVASFRAQPEIFLSFARKVTNAGILTVAVKVTGFRNIGFPDVETPLITDERFGVKVRTSEPEALFVYFE